MDTDEYKTVQDGRYREVKVVTVDADDYEALMSKSPRVYEYPEIDKVLNKYIADGWTPINLTYYPDQDMFAVLFGK